jgi:hypothetical protein
LGQKQAKKVKKHESVIKEEKDIERSILCKTNISSQVRVKNGPKVKNDGFVIEKD